MTGEFTERVLDLVERIPPGQVLSYGDVVGVLDQGFGRVVGSIMNKHGAAVPWWRVVRVDGTMAGDLATRALKHWDDEGTPLLSPSQVDMSQARWRGPFPR